MSTIRAALIVALLAPTIAAADSATLLAKRKLEIDGLFRRIYNERIAPDATLKELDRQYKILEQPKSLALSLIPALESETEIVTDEKGNKVKQDDDDAIRRNAPKHEAIHAVFNEFDKSVATLKVERQKALLKQQEFPYRVDSRWELETDRFGRFTIVEQKAILPVFDRWVIVDPNNPHILVSRALAESRAGKVDSAIKDLTKAIALATPPTNSQITNQTHPPIYVTALSARAYLQAAQGRDIQAARDFTLALKADRNQDNLDYYLFRAYAEYLQKKFGEAENKLVKATNLRPDDPECHRLLGLVYATCPIQARRDRKKGLAHGQRACELTKSECWACLYALAAAQAESGEYDQAAKSVAQAGELTIDENQAECLRCQQLYESKQPLRLDWK